MGIAADRQPWPSGRYVWRPGHWSQPYPGAGIVDQKAIVQEGDAADIHALLTPHVVGHPAHHGGQARFRGWLLDGINRVGIGPAVARLIWRGSAMQLQYNEALVQLGQAASICQIRGHT